MVACLLGLTSCTGASDADRASKTSSSSPDAVVPSVQADTGTATIAEVESRRLCDVATQRFPKETDIGADLDRRLSEAGLTHLQWKNWHDELSTSPSLVTQFAEISKLAC